MDFTSNTFILSQALVVLSTIVSVWSQQLKKREVILILFIIANLLNAGQFLLLSAFTGAAMSIIGAIRFGVNIFSTNKLWLILFLLINTIATYVFFEGYILSGTSYLASTFVIISTFLNSDHWMRVLIILGLLGWLIYGILIPSPMLVLSSALFIVSGIVGWYRHVYLVWKVPM
ncbi:MAG: YgjV family protein [bacterium]|nr:YgjV family protein [bacterium]